MALSGSCRRARSQLSRSSPWRSRPLDYEAPCPAGRSSAMTTSVSMSIEASSSPYAAWTCGRPRWWLSSWIHPDHDSVEGADPRHPVGYCLSCRSGQSEPIPRRGWVFAQGASSGISRRPRSRSPRGGSPACGAMPSRAGVGLGGSSETPSETRHVYSDSPTASRASVRSW
jgi:hypothetical protein